MRWSPVRFLVLSLTLASVLFAGGAARAQSTGATVDGTITDQSGGVLPGVTVTAQNEQTGLVRSTVTGSLGTYRISELPPGRYTLTISLQGFTTRERKGLALGLGADVTINVPLQVATQAENVTVTAQAPLIETSTPQLATSVTQKDVDQLPIPGNHFIQMALLAPGMSTDNASANAGSDNVSFGGISEQFKSLFLEGVDINDETTGGGTSLSDASRLRIPQDAVQEFQVLANQYSTEFGRSATGVINILTKSGTNQMAGRGFYYLRDDKFAKPNAFQTGQTPFRHQQFGGSLGGPIEKDKIFFFTTYEGRDYSDVVTVKIPAFVLPIITDPRTELPRVEKQHDWFGKLTSSVTPEEYLELTGLYAHRTRTNQDLGGNIAGDGGDNEKFHDYMFVGALTSVLSNTATNELRLSVGYSRTDRVPSGALGPQVIFPSIRFGQPTNHPQGRDQHNYIAMETFNWHHEGGWGTHDIKTGGEANIVTGNDYVNTDLNGQYVFLKDQLPVPGDPSTYPVLFQINTGNINLTQPLDMYAAYFEDKWRPKSALTLTLGVRYDRQFWRGSLNGLDVPTDIPTTEFWQRFVEGDLAGRNYKFMPNDPTNLAPRVGFTWASDDSRMVVRGGFGLYFQHIPEATGQGVLRNYPNVFFRQYANDVRVTGIPNLFFPAVPPISDLRAKGAASVSVPNPNNRFPYTETATIGFQHQLGETMSVSVDYVHTLGLFFPRSYNANAKLPDGTYPLLADGTIVNVTDNGNQIRGNQIQVAFQRRLSANLSFQSSYTYLRLFQFATSPVDAQNRNAPTEWGPAPNDVRHRFVFSGEYELPRGFQLGGVVTASSAPPYNVITGFDANGDRNVNDRPIVNGVMVGPYSARGDSYFDTDLRISKELKLSGARRIELFWEMFNLFNTKNYGGYNGNMRSVSFGQPSFALAPFQGQIGLRFDF